MSIFSVVTFDLSAVDAFAWTIFIIGFAVVFTALIAIYGFFFFLPKLLSIKIGKKKTEKLEKKKDKDLALSDDLNTKNSEVYAAIAMSLALYFDDQHDEESLVLTINLEDRINSQWSSKLQNVN